MSADDDEPQSTFGRWIARLDRGLSKALPILNGVARIVASAAPSLEELRRRAEDARDYAELERDAARARAACARGGRERREANRDYDDWEEVRQDREAERAEWDRLIEERALAEREDEVQSLQRKLDELDEKMRADEDELREQLQIARAELNRSWLPDDEDP